MPAHFCHDCGQPLVAGAAFCGDCGHPVEPAEPDTPAVTPLHEAVAHLVSERGEGILSDADEFRGAMDDYLDEATASAGTIYLLTEAVRLGAVEALRSMVRAGASPVAAVESAGERLARDRGSTDPGNAVWACAVLGHALGLVPGAVVDRYAAAPRTVERPPPPPPAPLTVRPLPGAAPPPPPLVTPPPVAYPGPVATPDGRRPVGPVVLVGVLAVLIMLGVGTGTAYLLTRGDDAPPDGVSDSGDSGGSDAAAKDRVSASTTSEGAGSPTATVTVTEDDTTEPDPESELRDAIDADADAVDSLVGYWVPQIASISGDINGSWSAALAEYERLKGFFPDAVVLDAADWPHAFVPSESFDNVFVVLVPTPASATSAPVLDWCQLNRGDRQASCYAKLLETTGTPRNNTDQNDPDPRYN